MIRERCGRVLNFLTVLAALMAGFSVMSAVQYVIFALDAFAPFLSGDWIMDSLYVIFAGQMVGAVVVYTVLLRLVRVKDAEFHPPCARSLRTTLLSLAGAFSADAGAGILLILIFVSIGIIPETGYTGTLFLMPEHLINPFNVVIFFAVGSVGAPIYEELLYRRTVIPLLEQRGASPLIAIVTSAALFGTVHLPLDLMYGNAAGALVHFVSVMTVGMFLGFVYLTTRNVVFPMLIHAIMNGLSFASIVSSLSSNLLSVGTAVSIIYLLLLIIGVVVIIRGLRQYSGAPSRQWVIMMKRRSPPCLRRGALWLLILHVTSFAVQVVIETGLVGGLYAVASPVFVYTVAASLNLAVFVLFAAITTRTEVAALPVVKEPPIVPDRSL